MYSSNLTTYPDSIIDEGKLQHQQRLAVQMDVPEPASYARRFTNYMGITEP